LRNSGVNHVIKIITESNRIVTLDEIVERIVIIQFRSGGLDRLFAINSLRRLSQRSFIVKFKDSQGQISWGFALWLNINEKPFKSREALIKHSSTKLYSFGR